MIKRAKEACNQAGNEVSEHFPITKEMVQLRSVSVREVDDLMLARYACNLVAQGRTQIECKRKEGLTPKKK